MAGPGWLARVTAEEEQAKPSPLVCVCVCVCVCETFDNRVIWWMPTDERTRWADTHWALSSRSLLVLEPMGRSRYGGRHHGADEADVLWTGQGPRLWYPLWSKFTWGPFCEGAHGPPLKAVLAEDAGVL